MTGPILPPCFFKRSRECSDVPIVARRVTCQWLACVLGLAVCGWHGAFAAELPLADAEAEQDVPDMNHVRAQAEAGRARSQTQLADSHFASGDFTNAVHWYRQAAHRGHVPAQLCLAGCSISGRGTVSNPAAAARVLRLAADTIESGDATGRVTHAVGAVASVIALTECNGWRGCWQLSRHCKPPGRRCLRPKHPVDPP
jgi:hypothetical protein